MSSSTAPDSNRPLFRGRCGGTCLPVSAQGLSHRIRDSPSYSESSTVTAAGSRSSRGRARGRPSSSPAGREIIRSIVALHYPKSVRRGHPGSPTVVPQRSLRSASTHQWPGARGTRVELFVAGQHSPTSVRPRIPFSATGGGSNGRQRPVRSRPVHPGAGTLLRTGTGHGPERPETVALDVVHLPPVPGLGRGPASQKNSIRSLAEADACMQHPVLPVLWPRPRECAGPSSPSGGARRTGSSAPRTTGSRGPAPPCSHSSRLGIRCSTGCSTGHFGPSPMPGPSGCSARMARAFGACRRSVTGSSGIPRARRTQIPDALRSSGNRAPLLRRHRGAPPRAVRPRLSTNTSTRCPGISRTPATEFRGLVPAAGSTGIPGSARSVRFAPAIPAASPARSARALVGPEPGPRTVLHREHGHPHRSDAPARDRPCYGVRRRRSPARRTATRPGSPHGRAPPPPGTRGHEVPAWSMVPPAVAWPGLSGVHAPTFAHHVRKETGRVPAAAGQEPGARAGA